MFVKISFMRILFILLLLSVSKDYALAAETINCPGLGQIVFQIQVVSENIANANTTRAPQGGPYKPKTAYCNMFGCDILERETSFQVYEPKHIDANVDGLVSYPSIDTIVEMNQMIELQRLYEQRLSECRKIN